MGVIAESFVAYAQPLFDESDGSQEGSEQSDDVGPDVLELCPLTGQ